MPLPPPREGRAACRSDGGDPLGAAVLNDATMSTPRSPFLKAAIERGFVHQCTDLEALDARLHEDRVTAYVGYDCTADSLHVGSLVSIMLLRLWQRCGHKPIVLMGGGTTRSAIRLSATPRGLCSTMPRLLVTWQASGKSSLNS